MLVFNAIFPAFAFLALGVLLRWVKLIKDTEFTAMNRLVYYVALPAMLFSKTATLQGIPGDYWHFYGAFLFATLASLSLGLVCAKLFGWTPKVVGAVAHAGFRGNLAFVGLPVVLSYLGTMGRMELESFLLLLLPPMIILYNVLGVLTLLLAEQGFQRSHLRTLTWQIITNPLILSSLLGLLYLWLGWPLPHLTEPLFEGLNQMVVPLSLLSVGGAIRFHQLKGEWFKPTLPALLKSVGTPLLGWGFASWLGLGLEDRVILALLLASPTAAAAVILAEQLKSDETLTANALMLSTFGALASMSMILWFFG